MTTEYADLPEFLATRTGEAHQAQVSTSDYGSVGDQRPYQIVQPSYPAPKFLSRFTYLEAALRECGTLCQTTGQPFRLVKWGSRVPCYPCGGQASTSNLLPRYIRSPGALKGYPEAQPIADFQPGGSKIVYGPDGRPTLVGAPNYIVSRTPTPPSNFVDFKSPIPTHYLEAVKTAQYLAETTGRTAYICSSAGASCKSRDSKKWLPVVYVDPGGLVRRYHQDMQMPPGVTSARGSIAVINPVTEDEFRELVRESEGGSRLGKGA
jgi:hypothetical protein